MVENGATAEDESMSRDDEADDLDPHAAPMIYRTGYTNVIANDVVGSIGTPSALAMISGCNAHITTVKVAASVDSALLKQPKMQRASVCIQPAV